MDNNDFKRYCLTIKGRLFGVEKSTIQSRGEKYMTRWILYCGIGTLRLHKFYRGDDDRASHTHPWWFITFPLSSYAEYVYDKGRFVGLDIVRAFRWHYRPANYEHIVQGGVRLARGKERAWVLHDGQRWMLEPKPFWTIVISGHRENRWGFYPKPNKFVYWRDYI